MTDNREAILVRLLELFSGIPGVVQAGRNTYDASEHRLPAIIVWDADESAEVGTKNRGRPTYGPCRVTLSPGVYVLAKGSPEEIGSALNSLRTHIIRAVLTDTELARLCVDGELTYEGCITDLARERELKGQMTLMFSFTYLLRPDQF